MSQTDNWPQAPILAALPEVARLRLQYDVGLLRADLAKLSGTRWMQPRIVSGDGLGSYVTDLDWRSLSLCSPGGDPERTDAGGPGLVEFADTPRLTQTPYFAEVLASIPAPLRAVRLMALGPGAESPYHCDTRYGLPWGTLRLHIPVITTPGAILVIGENTHVWSPGKLWYADFTRMHLVRNVDPVTRVHLVIDCQPTEKLLELMPAAFQSSAVRENTLFAASEPPLSEADLGKLRCRFALPRSFASFEEPNGAFTTDQDSWSARIDRYNDGLGLYTDDGPMFRLVPVGPAEFRFAGWSRERTVAVRRADGGTPRVRLCTRVGAVVRSLEMPAAPLSAFDRTVDK